MSFQADAFQNDAFQVPLLPPPVLAGEFIVDTVLIRRDDSVRYIYSTPKEHPS